jgi:clan AA aspartic protease
MIEGRVNEDFEAVIELVLVAKGRHVKIEAALDTGFNGFLTLPTQLVRDLELQRLGRGRAIVAHGGEEVFEFFGATVIWDGEPRRVETTALENAPLIGMEMLLGYDLFIEVAQGGRILIQLHAERH